MGKFRTPQYKCSKSHENTCFHGFSSTYTEGSPKTKKAQRFNSLGFLVSTSKGLFRFLLVFHGRLRLRTVAVVDFAFQKFVERDN
jgi:hypothetical protein